MTDSTANLQDEINKRITLNLLIQGSAQHAFLTSHHLVRDELSDLNPDLVLLYDQIALAGYIQYWNIESALAFGLPDRFWRRIASRWNPFHRHAFLVRHGVGLVKAAKQRAVERCRVKGVTRIPLWFSLQFFSRIVKAVHREFSHKPALVSLAKRTTHEVWGIPIDRLDGALTSSVAFGEPRFPTNFRALMLRAGVAGFGGVLRQGSTLQVVGKGWVWPILSHELVKGTAELICMHGLNRLDSGTYEKVLKDADRIEYEPWMLQVGPELWRRLLLVLPADRPIAEMVMHLARMPAIDLERLMFTVVEKPPRAKAILAELGREDVSVSWGNH